MTSFFDDSLQQNANTLQSALDGLNSVGSDSSVGYENHSNNPFEYPSLTETTYPTDQFSTENHWHDAVFHSTSDPSLTQDINSWLDDDSNNSNPLNFTPPTIHVHYHPPHDYFNSPHSWENEHGINHHLLNSAESSSETQQVFHSSNDVNVSGSVDHRHYWVKPNNSNPGDGDSDSSSSNTSDTGSSSCIDANGDGVCDSGSSSSCGDGGSCGSDNN